MPALHYGRPGQENPVRALSRLKAALQHMHVELADDGVSGMLGLLTYLFAGSMPEADGSRVQRSFLRQRNWDGGEDHDDIVSKTQIDILPGELFFLAVTLEYVGGLAASLGVPLRYRFMFLPYVYSSLGEDGPPKSKACVVM